MEKEFVSVILAVFNEEDMIDKCVESVLRQSYENFELIVIDDCSTDRTYELVKKFSDDRIRLFRNRSNLGLTRSLNIGIEHSVGNYIARIDADDRYMPKKLEKQLCCFKNDQRLRLVVTGYHFLDMENRLCRIKLPPASRDDVLGNLGGGKTPFLHSSVMWRRPKDRSDFYNDDFKQGQDSELWARLLREGDLYVVEAPLVVAARNRRESIVGRRHPAAAARLKYRLASQNSAVLGMAAPNKSFMVKSCIKISLNEWPRRFLGFLGLRRFARKFVRGEKPEEVESFRTFQQEYYS